MTNSASMCPSRNAFGALACLVVTCVVAPPVRGASDAGQASDGGGCNGGREVPVKAEDSEGTTGDESSTGETSDPTVATTTSSGVCGDGEMDADEACDDGNDVEEDACPSGAAGQCKGAASCGDGFTWAGEEACDDGNMVGGDGCEADCTKTPTECGNNVKEPGEACDDGNEKEDDACPSGAVGQCLADAKCGDGFTWMGMEECDDGNELEDDACPSGAQGQCLADAGCGDGFVWMGVEKCDDGNLEDGDACPSGMGMCAGDAMCGDGFVRSGVEDCDDMNGEDLDECNNACASPRWVFVTSDNPVNSGNLGGVTGADSYCQGFADTAGLGGQYMAWLSGADPASAPATRFDSTQFTGWYLMPTDPPTPVALGWGDLTSPNEDVPTNYLQNAISFDESGKDIGDGAAWTNTNPDSTQRDPDQNCKDWSDFDSGKTGYSGHAKAGVLDVTWTDDSFLKCNGGNRLYCFQVD